MDVLMRKVQFIQDQCSDKKAKREQEEAEKNYDEFTKLRKKIARDIKDVRKQIQERNELLSQTDNNAQTVKMSSQVRSKIKEITRDAEELEGMYEDDKQKIEKRKMKKKEVPADEEQYLEQKAEIVDLCFKHIDECKNLERAGFGGGRESHVTSSRQSKLQDPTVSQLPDLEDEGFQMLKRNDAQIDKQLDQVADGVAFLKNLAVEMGKEIEMQNVIIDDLHKEVDKTQATLNDLNKRMKKILTDVRKADRFMIDLILLIILLGLVAYIYNVLS
mmetsp:Transcript_29396/g.41373  ORF Transcript_29396/g.41373 Transcript_29396/m.41373 type:complete len:274 (+) Transcript_29396:52-873(+)